MTTSSTSDILIRISTDTPIHIAPTIGTEILASAHDVFAYISPDFTEWGCDRVEHATPEISVDVYEQIQDAEYSQIFGSINQDIDRLVLTTPQIRSFIVNHAEQYLLEAEWTCFRFLFTCHHEYFVADVRVLANGTRDVRITRFLDTAHRHAKYRHRIVVPVV
jgi:hypothetical protein